MNLACSCCPHVPVKYLHILDKKRAIERERETPLEKVKLAVRDVERKNGSQPPPSPSPLSIIMESPLAWSTLQKGRFKGGILIIIVINVIIHVPGLNRTGVWPCFEVM